MPNTILTHKMIAREAVAMLSEKMNFIGRINRGREDEFDKAKNGYKIGDTVTIGIPVNQSVYDGPVFAGGVNANARTQTENSITLTIDTQKHVPIAFGAKEMTLNLTDFKERFLEPAMNNLASFVQADVLNRAEKKVYNQVGTPGITPNSRTPLALTKVALDKALAPAGDRTFLISSDTNAGIVVGTQNLFNPTSQISKNYMEGELGHVDGMDFYTNQSLPTILYGSNTTTLKVAAAGQTGTILSVTGTNAGDTLLAGTVFTIPGVFAVHPITNAPTSVLRTFVIVADVVAQGTTTNITIAPALSATLPNATVTTLPLANAPLNFFDAAGAARKQNLAFHKDAFTMAFAPLPILESCTGANARNRDFSVRVMTFGDGYNDVENTRIDVLYGFAAPRPEWAVRLTE